MTGRRSETFEDLASYIFSLPRISTEDFPLIKGKIDRSTGINYSSVNFKWAKSFFVASRLIAEVNANQPTRVAMIWLRVKVNRTRLCTAAHFERNEIKYQKSRESGLFQHILYACSITCLSFIGHLYCSINRSFTNVTRCPLQ